MPRRTVRRIWYRCPSTGTGEALLMATPTDSPTGGNLAALWAVRLGWATPATCPMIEGEVEVLEIDTLPQERGDRIVAQTGFDPRALATP